jgi:diguanylate cyclase
MSLEHLDILGIRDTLPISMAFITVLVIYYIAIFIIVLFYYKNKKATNEIRSIVIYLVFAILETVVFIINKQKGSSYFMLIGATIYIILALFNRYKEYTERRRVKEYKEYFERVAYTDALTRGGNRAGFYRDLETITDPEGYFIIQADTDRLKYINDYFGHSNGDLAIIDTYKVLNKNFSKIGKIYRIGGDEFSVIVKGVDKDEIDRIIEQVKKDVDLIAEEKKYDFSVSFGAIMYNSSLDKDINATIVRADHKMYEDKKRLRGTLPQKMPVI